MKKIYHQMNEAILPGPELINRLRQTVLEPEKGAHVRQPMRRLGLAAVCCLLIVSVLSVPALSKMWSQQEPPLLEPGGTEPDTQGNAIVTPLIPGEHQERVLLQNGELHFGNNAEEGERKWNYADWALSEKMRQESWTQEQMTAYLGRDFRPGWVPEDLKEYESASPAYSVYFGADDQIFIPFFGATYSESFDTDYDPYRRTLTIQADKDEIPFTDAWYLHDSEQTSVINGVEVLVGYQSMPWGYSPKPEHKPSGYYDIYTAVFVADGIGYRIVAENLTQEEFIRVLLSILG